jgi:elongation factor P
MLRENFRAGQRVPEATVEKLKMCYQYRDGQHYVMLDVTGTQSLELAQEDFGSQIVFLKEGIDGIEVWLHRSVVLLVELPTTVELVVADTTPDQRGDTASGSGKRATLETGAEIRVPFHIRNGDMVRVDTRSGVYIGRVRSE